MPCNALKLHRTQILQANQGDWQGSTLIFCVWIAHTLCRTLTSNLGPDSKAACQQNVRETARFLRLDVVYKELRCQSAMASLPNLVLAPSCSPSGAATSDTEILGAAHRGLRWQHAWQGLASWVAADHLLPAPAACVKQDLKDCLLRCSHCGSKTCTEQMVVTASIPNDPGQAVPVQ